MSEDILSVSTPFPDVATLAQGYINRVDGERLLIPLEQPCGEGEGVRFVIYLGDGTAAFAGAGRCVQVSDQGTNVPPTARYETLVDSLELDDRSRPVYDYIVAVRAAAYGQTDAGEDAEAAEAEPEIDAAEAALDADVDADVDAHVDADADVDSGVDSDLAADSASVDVDMMSMPPAAAAPSEPAQPIGDDEAQEAEGFDFDSGSTADVTGDAEVSPYEEQPSELSAEDAEAATALASQYPDADNLQVYSSIPVAAPVPLMPSVRPGSIPTAALDSFRPEMASFIPPPLPTGILQRPARALHWQPAPPRRPTPLPQTGLFRYSGPGLPKPAAAPRPDLDPSQLVQRAPRP